MDRILLLIKGLGRGGAEQLLVSSAPYLDTERFRYEVAYLLPWKDALVGDLERLGLPVRCLDGARGVGWLGRLRALVRDRDIRLVHAHSPYAAVGARVGLPRDVVHVSTEHIAWSIYHRATYWANALTFPRNDHVFAVSEEVRRSIRYPRPVRGRSMPPIQTVHQGLDFARLSELPVDGSSVRAELGIAPTAPVVGMVGNFKAHKGYEYMLRAAVRVRARLPEVRFVLVGTGQEEGRMRRLAGSLGLNGTVIFTGVRDDPEQVISSFDVFAMSSLQEGLSIAMLEAMALGVPPVVTRVGGLPEAVVDGDTGILVPPADPEALAAGILRVLEDRSLREGLARRARDRSAAFDIRRAVLKAERVYRELLG